MLCADAALSLIAARLLTYMCLDVTLTTVLLLHRAHRRSRRRNSGAPCRATLTTGPRVTVAPGGDGGPPRREGAQQRLSGKVPVLSHHMRFTILLKAIAGIAAPLLQAPKPSKALEKTGEHIFSSPEPCSYPKLASSVYSSSK